MATPEETFSFPSAVSPPRKAHQNEVTLLATPPQAEDPKRLKHDSDEFRFCSSFSGSSVLPNSPPEDTRRYGSIIHVCSCSVCNESIGKYEPTDLLKCGHFVHVHCVSTETRDVICQRCFETFEQQLQNSVFLSNVSSVYENTESDLASLIEDSDEDVIAETYLHYTTETTAELIVKLEARKHKHTFRYEPTNMDTELAYLYTALVEWDIQFSNFPVPSDFPGRFRMHSVFCAHENSTLDSQEQLWAFLFEKYLVVLRPISDRSREVEAIFNILADDFSAYIESSHIVLRQGSTVRNLFESFPEHLPQWLAAIYDNLLVCPANFHHAVAVATPVFPQSLDDVRGVVEQVLCIPVDLVPVCVQSLLSCMQSQDRLGIVAVSKDGSTAYIPMHKPSWSGWSTVMELEMYSLDEFTSAYDGVLDTAMSLFSDQCMSLLSQSIVCVSGCPLSSTILKSTHIPIHSVEFMESGNQILTKISEQNAASRFQHVESRQELSECLIGLFQTEKNVRCCDVAVDVLFHRGVELVCCLGESRTVQTSWSGRTQVHVDVGRLIAGQIRCIVFELVLSDTVKDASESLNITSKSAMSRRVQHCIPFNMEPDISPQLTSIVPMSMVFGRMACIISEVLAQCIDLAESGQWNTLHTFISCASTNCEESARKHTDIEWCRVGVLAEVLKDFLSRFRKNQSRLYEAHRIMESQSAVRRSHPLHHLFFENLESNVI